MDRIFTLIAARVSGWAGQPLAFVLALSTIIVWGISGPLFNFSDTWQLVINTSTTIITFLMVFLIQNAQNRDAASIQAKLDELIRAIEGARNEFIGIEHLTETQLEQIRAQIEKDCGADDARSQRATLDKLIRRR
jgi:low affinity Fe/Cu permease